MTAISGADNLLGMPDAVIYVLAAWVGIASGFVIVIGSVYGGWRIFRRQWQAWMDDELMDAVKRLSHQLATNGGTHDNIGTVLLRIERRLGETPPPLPPRRQGKA